VIHNLAEEHVASSYEALRKHFPDFCGCDVCRADVLVFALNRTPPRYVGTLEGSVVTEVNLEKEQNRAAIDVIVMEGFRRIAATPRCGSRSVRRT
jgi:competence protein ComFB